MRPADDLQCSDRAGHTRSKITRKGRIDRAVGIEQCEGPGLTVPFTAVKLPPIRSDRRQDLHGKYVVVRSDVVRNKGIVAIAVW